MKYCFTSLRILIYILFLVYYPSRDSFNWILKNLCNSFLIKRNLWKVLDFKYYIFFSLGIIFSCETKMQIEVEEGVSRILAKDRAQNISKVNYELAFFIPKEKSNPIMAKETLSFNLKSADKPVVLDFNANITKQVIELIINGKKNAYEANNGHIILSSDALIKGYNTVNIDFEAGDLALNRNDDYLYTLFVPDRASTAFPCFDQPDIKAKYKLLLDIPENWIAISNGAIDSENANDGRNQIQFKKSDLISTYLFSFTAGKFQSITRDFGDRTMTMFHRETDTEKVTQNIDEIFQQHYDVLMWLEDYTNTKYPFQKFDFILIPDFQYRGMEHVGAIQYRASSLMLESYATLDDKISRIMLIAHETAHTWFGNLVTMEWFDDVWMKEVFANFMASKFTELEFPEINHDLNFLFSHYPQAYSVDRTEGTNAIRQKLDNLKDAGNMYGAIIYHKAPIVIKQLEQIIGETSFRESLRTYLDNYQWKNATWEDLVQIFDIKTDKDIITWSKVWIDESGMPYIDLEIVETDEIHEYDIVQYDLTGKERVWIQNFNFDFTYEDGDMRFPIYMDNVHFIQKKNAKNKPPQFIQLNSTGLGYGTFSYGLDYIKNDFLFNKAKVDIPSITNSLKRGAAYITLHEYLLFEGMNPQMYLSFIEEYVKSENNKLILSYLLNNLELIFWKFLKPEQWKTNAPIVENILWEKMQQTNDLELKHAILNTYINVSYSNNAIERLLDLWNGEDVMEGLSFSESEAIKVVYHIALKSTTDMTEIINLQIDKLNNPDSKLKMKFVSQALSSDVNERDEFFNKLLKAKNRTQENWVSTALYYLHHPIRNSTSINYLKQSLDILPEIQKTGDIFFPKNWLDNTLWGYNSKESIQIINDYIEKNPSLNPHLKVKLLQAADMVFRAERDIFNYYAEDGE